MSDVDYFVKLHEQNSLRELLDAYEEESRILRDIMEDDDYSSETRENLKYVQRDHLEAIKSLIDRKSK